MGSIFGKLFSKLWSKKELKIIIIGLDNSGKTTILSTTPFTQTNSTSTKSSRPCPVTVSSFSHRLQHGSSPVQKFAVPGVGPWRAEFHQARITFIQTVLGDVLPQHQRHSLRGHDKQRFSKAGEELSKVLDVLFAYPERDTTRRSSPDSSKQAGFARRFF